MVASAMLQNHLVRACLGGVEPGWTLLDHPSFDALRRVPPMSLGGPIRLADPSAEELRPSPFASGTAALLGAAVRGGGLQLTATGNLFRAAVAELVDCFAWPAVSKPPSLFWSSPKSLHSWR